MHTRVSVTDNVWYTSNILLTIREKQDVIGIHGKIKKTQSFLKIKKTQSFLFNYQSKCICFCFFALKHWYKIGMSGKNIYVCIYVCVYILPSEKVHLLSIMTS